MGRKKRARVKKQMPLWQLVMLELAAVGAALLVFALFHHILPQSRSSLGITSERVSSGNTVVEVSEEGAAAEPDIRESLGNASEA